MEIQSRELPKYFGFYVKVFPENIFPFLLWQLGRFVPYPAIEDVMWGGRENGGPLNSKQIIYELTHQLRKEGHSIEMWRGVGLKMRRAA